jgi:hypothetical protein
LKKALGEVLAIGGDPLEFVDSREKPEPQYQRRHGSNSGRGFFGCRKQRLARKSDIAFTPAQLPPGYELTQSTNQNHTGRAYA